MKKLCENCTKSYRTRAYCFKDPNKQWTRYWCRKCMKEWKSKHKGLDELGVKHITRLDKFKLKIKQLFLRLKRWKKK